MDRILEVTAFMWSHWRRYPWMLAGLFAGMGAAVLLDIFLPLVAGRLIDAVATVAVDGPTSDQISAAIWALALFVGISVGFHLARFLSFRLWIPFAGNCMRNIVSDAFHRVQRYSTDWHANTFAGATVRKISRGMWAYDTLADTIYIGLFPSICVLVGVTISLALHWPLIGLVTGVGIVVYWTVSIMLATRYVAPLNRVSNRMDSSLGAALADSISCNAVVKAFGAEPREDERLRGVVSDWRHAATSSWLRMENMGLAQMGILVAMQIGLLGLVLWFWSRGEATAGGVTFVMTSYFLVHGYMRDIGQHIRNLQQGVNELEDVVEFAKLPLGVPDVPGAAPLLPKTGAVTFDNVTFRYGNQPVPLYRDFTLEIGDGERVALVGKSGSGKSTFVKLVQRLYDVDVGRVLIDGQDIARCTQESLRGAIAVVPQDPVLFHRSLAENIAYGRPDATEAEIVEAATRANAHEFIQALPHGYETLVGERGVKLSGGERQRVAIARAILADTPLLILDEATSSLDSITEAQIQEAIEDLMRGRTTIVIAHRLATVRSVDRILVFAAGAVVEHGTHAELMARPDGHYRELHHMQVERLAS